MPDKAGIIMDDATGDNEVGMYVVIQGLRVNPNLINFL